MVTRRIILAAVMAAAWAAAGGEVSSGTARAAAQKWIDLGCSMGALRGRTVAEADTYESAGTKLHVVKLAGGGFVAMSADDLVRPVLAFAPSGSALEPDERNPLWSILVSDLARRTRAMRAASASASGGGGRVLLGASSAGASGRTEVQRLWDRLTGADAARPLLGAGIAAPDDVRVAPLVGSQWGQSENSLYVRPDGTSYGQLCYNYYTPDNDPCGCVATAMAQIMRYHRYPSASRVVTSTCIVDRVAMSLTTKGGPYDYGSMPLVPEARSAAANYAGGATEDERRAIGALTYDCAVAMQTQWDPDGGSSIGGFAFKPLMEVFGYANARAYFASDESVGLSMSAVRQMALPNLDAGCPVMLSLYGHVVVADGYGYSDSVLYTHLNMGWSGMGDAWYALPDVEQEGWYASTVVPGVVYNIFPEETGELLSGRVTDADGAPFAGVTVEALDSKGRQVKATTKTDERGIYFLRLDGGTSMMGVTYTVRATCGPSSASKTVTLRRSVNAASVDLLTGAYYAGIGINAMSYGNSWGNDFTLARAQTATTDVPVPYAWLDARYPGRAASAADYEALAWADGANGYAVWESYLAGLDPTNAASRLIATIRLVDGDPVIEWNVTNETALALGYEYRVKGKRVLDDPWSVTNATHRFFRVSLER